MANQGQVILIDDEDEVRLSGKQTLELEGFEVLAFASAEDAVTHISENWPGVVVTDVKMPKMNGFDLLKHVQDLDRELPVILITGHGDVAMAIQAIQGGAYDFVEKPAPPEYLIDVVGRALDKRRLVMENRALRDELRSTDGVEARIIGNAKSVLDLRKTIANIAKADIDVLLVGETGTGKELAARSLHDFSDRAGAFVALNCGALPETIIESELFGHEAGAFTGANKKRIGKIEFADTGTLFLDEIESMPAHLQVKLVRVLQERVIERLGGNEVIAVDIRVIAASKIDLAGACREGAFRDDLYYRLNVATIVLPPLREREGDIALLFHHFAAEAAARYQRPVPELTASDVGRLADHPWPGNVRELKNAAERFILGLRDDSLDLAGGAGANEPKPLAGQVADFEKHAIGQALKSHQGKITATAKALGLPRKTLYLRMKKYGLKRGDYL